MVEGRARKLLEFVSAAAVAALVWAATWRMMRVGDFPPILPAAGLALAYLLVRGGDRWLPVVAGTLLGALATTPTAQGTVALGVAVIVPTLLTWALARASRMRTDLGRMRDVVTLPVAALLGGALGAALALPLVRGAGLVPPGGSLAFWEHLTIANLTSVLLFTVPVFALRLPDNRWRAGRRSTEIVLVCAATLTAAAAVFLTSGSPSIRFLGMGLLVMPLMAWVTLRAHPGVATSLLATVLLLAATGAAQGLGPFGAIPVRIATRTLQSFGGAFGFFTSLLVANELARRRALEATTKQAERLRRVIEGSNDGFWEWDAATDVVEVSDRLARMFGYEVHEFIRYPREYTALTHPDDEAASVAAVRDHFAGLTGHYSTEYRMRHRNGGWVWVLDRGRVTERGPGGEPLRASGTMTDITERKQAELALRTSQMMFDNFMRHNTAVAFIRDREGRVRWTNRAYEVFLLGRESSEAIGRSLDDFYPPEVAARMREADAEVLASKRPVVAEEHVVRGGRDMWWLTARFPIRLPDGETLIGGTAVEITDRQRMAEERRELEARMMEAQKLEGLGLLAGGIAHDFNNILTGILGYADLARQDVPAGSPLAGNLDQIVAGARSAANLTQQMLTYAGRGRAEMRPLAMSALVAEMGHLLHVSIPKRISLRYEFGRDLPAIEGDEAQLRQVVMNLIVNAAESMGDASGSIVVRVRAAECDADALRSRWGTEEPRPGPHVVLEVADTGCGMEPDTLARIFDPFFSTKFTGRGLGLAAVLGIVRGHHGVIHTESAPGAGTTFRVFLPAFAPAAPPPRPESGDTEWHASGTALVVDDEPGVRAIACAMLARMGFEHVLSASGGGEGVRLFREHAPEIRLVLLDVTMPDLDGHTVLREILAVRPDARVVMSSGYGDTASEGGASPAAGFVGKPYRLAEFTRAVRAAMESVPAS